MTSKFVIRGAQVVDGSGKAPFEADVLVDGDRIGAIGHGGPADIDIVDAAGRVLAPGFIDTHSHDDFAVVLHPDMAFKVNGGVTTVVVGNCGSGAAPLAWNGDFPRMLHGDRAEELPDFGSFADYFDHLDSEPPSVNVAALAGHGTARAGVVGREAVEATDEDLRLMRQNIAEAMDAGCVGMSTGLVYVPGRFGPTGEIVELAREVAGRGGVYTSHIRDEGDELLEAVGEAIDIGAAAGLGVVVSHLKAAGVHNFGKVNAALDRISAAGESVTADQYPYAAGSTGLTAVVDGGIKNTSPDSVVVASTSSHPEWHGRSIADIASDLGVDAESAAATALQLEPEATVVLHIMSEDDVRTVVGRPDVMVGSDGVPTMDGQPHPRLYGTFARVLGFYARDLGLLSIEQAVHKMTGLPARVFGLEDRGLIKEGAVADMVLFDPDTVLDRGTYTDPHQYPSGIDKVWVGGNLVVDTGTHTGRRPGKVLRRL